MRKPTMLQYELSLRKSDALLTWACRRMLLRRAIFTGVVCLAAIVFAIWGFPILSVPPFAWAIPVLILAGGNLWMSPETEDAFQPLRREDLVGMVKGADDPDFRWWQHLWLG